MYNDMYNNFDNSEFQYYYPYTFNEQNRNYLIKKDNPDYMINGKVTNTIDLYAPATPGTVNLIVKNFRYEIVFKVEDITYTSPIAWVITPNLLKAGLYSIEIEDNGINGLDNITLRKVLLVK